MVGPTTVTCPQCGRVYRREIHKLPVRDQDSFECKCGYEIERWSSSTYPVFVMIKDVPNAG